MRVAVSARAVGLGVHPSGGGDMEIQKAYLKHNLVTSSVCLLHNYTFHCGLTAVIGEKAHQ